MILIKDGTRYYIVNNNGSLTEVGYDESTNEVSVTDPMLWTIDNDKGHIYFHSEATGFGTNLIASDYYRRYLDPSSEKGWLEEKSWPKNNAGQYTGSYAPGYVKVHKDGDFQNNGETVEINHVEDRSDALADTALTIGNDGTISQGNYYLAIERDAAGTPVSIKRQEGSSGAAQFVFATASKVPSGLHLENAVNHIDISIKDSVEATIPLAYGVYYNAAGEEVLSINETSSDAEKTLVVIQDVAVSQEHLRAATIEAECNGTVLNDAFYITGYSSNSETAYSTNQVRIEGMFKVAHPAGYDPVPDTYADWQMNSDEIKELRKNNQVRYTVTAVEPDVKFYLVHPTYGQLYDANGKKIYGKFSAETLCLL